MSRRLVDLVSPTTYNEINMKQTLRFGALLLLLALPGTASIYRITVDAPVHPISSEYITRSIDKAARDNASLLILDVSSPRNPVGICNSFPRLGWGTPADVCVVGKSAYVP